MTCLGITGAMRTAAMEIHLGLPPLYLQMEAEAKIGNYRLCCNESWKPKSEGFGHACMNKDKETEPILQMGSDKMIPRHVYENPFTIRFPDRCEWNKGFRPDKKGGLIWYTDGPKTEDGTGAGVYFHDTKIKLSFSLGRYTTVFQAELYAIKACAEKNMDRNYKNRNIYILSGSQAAIKALGKYQITSILVWDFHQSLMQLARHNRVQLIWVPGHKSIAGNETADHLAKTGSEHPFTEPELASGISFGVAKGAVRDWMNKIILNTGSPLLDSNRQRNPLPKDRKIF
jgi:ribonuclease HI